MIRSQSLPCEFSSLRKRSAIARPRDELELHVDAGLGGEVLGKLDQRIGRVPGRPAERQLLVLGAGAADRRARKERGRGQHQRSIPQFAHPFPPAFHMPGIPPACPPAAQRGQLSQRARSAPLFSILFRRAGFTELCNRNQCCAAARLQRFGMGSRVSASLRPRMTRVEGLDCPVETQGKLTKGGLGS